MNVRRGFIRSQWITDCTDKNLKPAYDGDKKDHIFVGRFNFVVFVHYEERGKMKILNDLLVSSQEEGKEEKYSPGELDLLLYAPCPIKLAIKERLDKLAEEFKIRGKALRIHIPMGCTSIDPYDPLHKETEAEKLPAMIASIGFGDFFRKDFVHRFVDPGLFDAVLPEKVHPTHQQAGSVDPKGHYVVYGVTPYIFLVDTLRLDNTPLPSCWEDLLHPRYKGQINMCGDGDDMADAVLINIYKEFGQKGIERFAANTFGLMHSSHMAQSGGVPKSGAIYIIPYFFAESTLQPVHMKVIWPQDGAAASPLYFLVKQCEQKRLKRLISFFTQGIGTIDSARWFLPLGGPMPTGLSQNAKIKWVGWEFIENCPIADLRDELSGTFRRLVSETPCAS
jgi:ABC-type Fe3+ transport system substrate-binding protein